MNIMNASTTWKIGIDWKKQVETVYVQNNVSLSPYPLPPFVTCQETPLCQEGRGDEDS